MLVQDIQGGHPIVDYRLNFVQLGTFPRSLDTEVLHFDASQRLRHDGGWGVGS